MKDISNLVRIQLAVVLLFIVGKSLLRPYVLNNDFPNWTKIFVLSFPNFCEAVAGTLLLTCFGLIFNHRGYFRIIKLKEQAIYGLATLFAAIYVITQEFKVHNIGGKNVYDPYDVMYSVVGLIATYLLLIYLKPEIR